MPLRVGFDLDGVLADMEGELIRQAEGLFGQASTRHDKRRISARSDHNAVKKPSSDDDDATSSSASQRLLITARQQRQLWRHVASIENFWETLDETEPGIVARLAAAAAELRWEVLFLTKRPRSAGATAQVQSQRWLASHGFPLPSAYVVEGSRGLIAAAMKLDVVIDDRPENCLDVVSDSRARALLVWRADESRLVETARRLGIGVVRSVDECLGLLRELDARSAVKPAVKRAPHAHQAAKKPPNR